jgi:molybdopterin molybdotransferase
VRVPAVAAGRNVARRGEQARAGETVVRAGTRVRPATVGVLAVAGKTSVLVAARPRVAVLATGDELVPASEAPGPSRIRDSNGHALVAQVTRAGGVAAYAGPVRDVREALDAAVEEGLEADVLCSTGGVSVGERDLVPDVLAAAGVERVFHRWAVKPGGPLWFGRKGPTLVFGLPGNPAATFVGFEVLVVPALRALAGEPFAPRGTRRATFRGASGKAIPRRRYVPVRLEEEGGRARAVPTAWTGSGDPFGLALADALAVLPEGAAFGAEDAVEVDAIPLGEAS